MKVALHSLLGLVLFLGISNTCDAKTFKNELKFYIIKPKFRLNWKSPRSIAIKSALNSLGKNYAPIGHFAVEVNCELPNEMGVSHVLTGMEQHGSVKSSKVTLKKKLGFGSVVSYDWPGDLQSVEDSLRVIEKAKYDGRLTTVIVPTSASRCHSALKYINAWIENGSYTVYGGNKNAFKGEGSGCADFALVLFHIATSVTPVDDIFVHVNVPHKLIGDGEGKKAPFWKILLAGKWAQNVEDGVLYTTPETNRTVEYLQRTAVNFDNIYLYLRHLKSDQLDPLIGVEDFFGSLTELLDLIGQQVESLLPYEHDEFVFPNKFELREPTKDTWDRISIKDKRKNEK